MISDVPDNGCPDSISVNMSWTRGSTQTMMDMQHKQEMNIGCLHVIKSLTPFFDVGLLISFKPYHSSFSSVAHLHKPIKKKKKSWVLLSLTLVGGPKHSGTFSHEGTLTLVPSFDYHKHLRPVSFF